MTANVKNILSCLDLSSKPLCFVIVVPGWDDCDSYKSVMASKYLRRKVTMGTSDHFYKDGMQHRANNRKLYRPAFINSLVFIMQNDAGNLKWPVTEEKIQKIIDAFS